MVASGKPLQFINAFPVGAAGRSIYADRRHLFARSDLGSGIGRLVLRLGRIFLVLRMELPLKYTARLIRHLVKLAALLLLAIGVSSHRGAELAQAGGTECPIA